MTFPPEKAEERSKDQKVSWRLCLKSAAWLIFAKREVWFRDLAPDSCWKSASKSRFGLPVEGSGWATIDCDKSETAVSFANE
jgi:hypothetical protein